VLQNSLTVHTTTSESSNGGECTELKQGDQLSGKPENVREFDSVKEMSGILLKVREMSGKKSCPGTVA